MIKEQIFESGFITAFIREYFDDKIHCFYPDKDRLLYILCNNDQEKKEVTKGQIENTKAKISELGFEGLSFVYLLSCKPESLHDYIEPNKRFDFWLHRFSEEIEDHILYFDPITKSACIFNEVPELTNEVFENEIEFWEWYPKEQCPKIMDLLSIIPSEADLLSLIEYDILEYNKNEYWEFDFKEYERFIDVSKPIEILFNLSELLVQLNRLEMFNEFLEIEALPPQQSNNPKPEPKETELSEKIKKHFGFMLDKDQRKNIQILKDDDFSKLIKWTTYFFKNNFEVPEISKPIKSVNTSIYITQLAFQILFDELRKTGFHKQKTKSNTALFNLWKSCFEDYKEYSEQNFYKVKRTNKDTGVNYEDEVKKLMQID